MSTAQAPYLPNLAHLAALDQELKAQNTPQYKLTFKRRHATTPTKLS